MTTIGGTAAQAYRAAGGLSSAARAVPQSPASPQGLPAGADVPRAGGGDTVEISSGRSVMLSRLFSTSDPEASPEIYRPGSAPSSGLVYKFLTSDDRDMISGVYEYARANGIEPLKVDNLAFDLACFRHRDPRATYVDTVGQLYDENNVPLIFEFEPGEEQIAQRVLTSKAIKDNVLPEDFLRTVLDPGLKPVHAVDFDFLEQVVYATSASGSDGATDPHAVLAPRPKERLALMQASGMLRTPDADLPGSLAGASDDAELFARYASRIEDTHSWLTDSDKNLLGSLYARTAEQHGADSPQMKQIDELARTLAALYAAGFLSSAKDHPRPTTLLAGGNAER